MYKYFLALLLISGLACYKPIIQRLVQRSEVPEPTSNQKLPMGLRGQSCCNDYSSYAPDTMHLDHSPMKYIRVNVHFMNSADSTNNFDEEAGVTYALGLLKAANYDIETNDKLFLPYGNDLPNLPPQYRYVLTPRENDPGDDGIYFHYDDELYYYIVRGRDRNRHKTEVIKKYGVQLDTVLNIFLMPHHPDSTASPTYKASQCGIALGDAVKVAGGWESGPDFWQVRMVLNHEVGHIYGLSHTWAYNDGCDDTPRNPQCWNRTDEPPCDTAASNNLMDYNAYQRAWSPCQIGKIHYTMSNLNSKSRRYLVPNWCTLHEDKHIFIQDSVHWQSMKDLEGNLTIQRGGILQISCRVAIPPGGKITVQPGGKLILDNCLLHNSCGEMWDGIEIQEQGKYKGEVVFVGEPVIQDVIWPELVPVSEPN
ncbi:MAG: hypothetical protein KDC34_03100 [Saprospiraceae bacterium]|nr:hypothetical protein [Saprospiraceae bacterium]